MYFAGQALFTCVIGAIAAGVYDAIKNLFIPRDFSQILMVDAELMESVQVFTAREAIEMILEGSRQKTVYAYLEKMHDKLKRKEFDELITFLKNE